MEPETIRAIIEISSVLLATFGGGGGIALSMFLNKGKKELLKVIDASDPKNEDLKELAVKEGCKIAARWIK